MKTLRLGLILTIIMVSQGIGFAGGLPFLEDGKRWIVAMKGSNPTIPVRYREIRAREETFIHGIKCRRLTVQDVEQAPEEMGETRAGLEAIFYWDNSTFMHMRKMGISIRSILVPDRPNSSSD